MCLRAGTMLTGVDGPSRRTWQGQVDSELQLCVFVGILYHIVVVLSVYRFHFSSCNSSELKLSFKNQTNHKIKESKRHLTRQIPSIVEICNLMHIGIGNNPHWIVLSMPIATRVTESHEQDRFRSDKQPHYDEIESIVLLVFFKQQEAVGPPGVVDEEQTSRRKVN